MVNVKTPPSNQEVVLERIQGMSREALMEELLNFRGSLRLDFTREFLDKLSDEKLRHVLLAAHLYGHPVRLPGAKP